MKKLIHTIASMKITVALLVVVLVAMAAGTIVESLHGTETALRNVYYAPWFEALLALFGLQLLASIVDHYPWGWSRAGYLFTHGSMIVILTGSLVSAAFKTEGKMALWEGEERATFAAPAATEPTLALPFKVRLDSFEIDFYQGTRRPAMFRSRVTVTDPGTAPVPAVIEMNRELSHRGYKLFQSSYQQESGRKMTVLAVSRDPGQPIVFAGYFLLMAGMITVLATRIAQRRALIRLQAAVQPVSAKPHRARSAAVSAVSTAAAHRHAPAAHDAPRTEAVIETLPAQKAAKNPKRSAGRAALLILAATLVYPAASPPRAATLPGSAMVETVRRIPVQHDGRVMPFDTLAREAVWNVTSRAGWKGADPAAIALGWSLDPQGWAMEPIVRLGGGLASEIGLTPGRVSFAELAGNQRFLSLIDHARAKSEADQPLTRPEQDAQKIEERLVWMQGFMQGTSLAVVPAPGKPNEAWSPLAEPRSVSALAALVRNRPAGWPSAKTIDREIVYNRARPSRIAWITLVLAMVLSLLGWNLRRRWIDALAVVGLGTGFVIMTWGIATRWQIAGRIPASNMYESLLFLGWGVALFALVALIFLRNRLVVLNATAMSALTMLLVDRLPIDPFIHPVPPVLAGTAWLAIHVPIIMLSYSVLALGVLIAHMQIGFSIFAPARRDLALKMNDLLYWYIHVGSILLISGIITGSMWASSSWGRYWGWDPKEVWSLIAFVAYMAILHGRLDKIIGVYGVAALSIVAFWAILFTYIGVNFVLTSGMHSYGFGSSSVTLWLSIVGAAEAIFLLVGLFSHAARRGSGGPIPARA